jgi:predicted ATPase/DNA-binding winged helix-turn-helix (wHTH) protein
VEETVWRDVCVPSDDIRSVYAADSCEIDLARCELRIHGSFVPVGGRAFQIIEVLVRSAGELVTKDQLLDRIWPGTTVGENTLHVHAGAIRKALGSHRNLLKTVSGRGYRLLGDWTVRHHAAAGPPVGVLSIPVIGDSPVTNFPATVTHLIGRSAAVTRLRDFLSAYRLVTLTGAGGVGKSTLALKASRGVVGEFADGGWLVELASLSDPTLVPFALASALRLELGPNSVTPEAVCRAIGHKKLLLVLDNCEHLIDAVATLAETLLASCPHTTIVTTSREILRIQGEQVWRVPPLEVPAIGQTGTAEILGHGAVELFLTRTRQLGADFASDPRYPPMIATICRRLDGIPLAIEFAAARAVTLGVEQVASGLRNRFAMLTNGRRTALPRHRTLRATLDWSYQLLSEAERDLLRRLAIFAGPFSLDAARAVAAEVTREVDVTDALGDLVGKSLLVGSADPVNVAFRLLETTRVYAMDRLTESGRLAEVARRHASYFLTTLRTIGDEQRSRHRDEYLAAFRHHADEVHVALDWAFSATGVPAVGVALTIAAVPLWFELFQMPVARRRVEQALPHAETGSEEEMRLCIVLGHAVWYTTPDSEALEPPFARALEIAERTGASTVRTQALWGMWAARRGRGDYHAALESARRYAEAASSTGDPGAIHLGDRILGLTHHILGQQQLARGFAERALRQPRHLDAASGIGLQIETPVAMRALLARVLWLSGFPDQAIEAAAEATAAVRKTGHPFAISYAVTLAGLPVALWTGDMAEARRQLDLLVAHAGGVQRMEVRVRAFERVLKLRSGDEREALIASFIETHWDPAHLPPFADLNIDANIRVPLPGAEPVHATWNAPEVLRVDAECLLWHDGRGHDGRDADIAVEAKLLRALEIAREQSTLSWELRGAMSLARLWWRLGRVGEARDLLTATYGKFTEGFDTGDLIRARSLMVDLEADGPSA